MTSKLSDRHLFHCFAASHAMKVKASSGEQLLSQVFTHDPLHIILLIHLPFSFCLPGSSICLSPFSFLLNHSDSILVYLLHSYIHCTSSSENIISSAKKPTSYKRQTPLPATTTEYTTSQTGTAPTSGALNGVYYLNYTFILMSSTAQHMSYTYRSLIIIY